MLIGVVGKPNVGKSTFFKALTLAEVETAPYPFTTIKPNHGIGYVRVECVDKEFNVKCRPKQGYCADSNRFVPIEILDVAGLVPGAHKGKGLGNKFLDDLRQADALIHVLDASGSSNEKGEPVEQGSYNAANDIRFLETELDMWYLQILKKPWEKFAKQVYMEKQKVSEAIAKQFSGLNVTEDMVKDIIEQLQLDAENLTNWSEDNLKSFAVELRKRTKPAVIAANKADLAIAKKNIEDLKKQFPDYTIIPCSAESELALKEAAKHNLISYIPGDSSFKIINNSSLSEKQRQALEFIEESVLKSYGSSGVEEVINTAVFKVLNRIAVYPVANAHLTDKDGNVLPDCFLVPQNITALEFAFKVHTDLGENFVNAVHMKKKLVVGKEHRLQHRDVIEIVATK
jgi:hypothetical protein